MAEDSVMKVFNTVEALQSIARFLSLKDLSNFEKISSATREAVEWERSLRDNHPKVIFLGHHGPLPNLYKANSVKLVIGGGNKTLNATQISFIKQTLKEVTPYSKNKKLAIEFPLTYPNLDDSIIDIFKQIKQPIELAIAQQQIIRTHRSGLKFNCVNSFEITFNRKVYLGLENILRPNAEECTRYFEAIKSIAPEEHLKQFTASSSVTSIIFRFPKITGFSHVTDLTVDEFDFPITRIDKKTFPALKSLRMIDPLFQEHNSMTPTPRQLFFHDFIPTPLQTLTIEYYKSNDSTNCFPCLKQIFPELTEITITGKYIPHGAFVVIQQNLHIPKLRIFGSVIFGSLTTIISGNPNWKGVIDMKGLKVLELGARSTSTEQYETIKRAITTLENLEEIRCHIPQMSKSLAKFLMQTFKCAKIEPEVDVK